MARRGQDDVQEASKMAQDCSRCFNEGPRSLQEGPRDAQDASRGTPGRPKSWKTYGFRSIFTIRRHSAQEASRGLQMAPRLPQDGAKTVQDGPKTVPRGSQGRFRGPKRGPKGFQEGSKEGPRGLQERTPNKLGSKTRPGSPQDPSGTLPDPFG